MPRVAKPEAARPPTSRPHSSSSASSPSPSFASSARRSSCAPSPDPSPPSPRPPLKLDHRRDTDRCESVGTCCLNGNRDCEIDEQGYFFFFSNISKWRGDSRRKMVEVESKKRLKDCKCFFFFLLLYLMYIVRYDR